jgi:hypothetical protein
MYHGAVGRYTSRYKKRRRKQHMCWRLKGIRRVCTLRPAVANNGEAFQSGNEVQERRSSSNSQISVSHCYHILGQCLTTVITEEFPQWPANWYNFTIQYWGKERQVKEKVIRPKSDFWPVLPSSTYIISQGYTFFLQPWNWIETRNWIQTPDLKPIFFLPSYFGK